MELKSFEKSTHLNKNDLPPIINRVDNPIRNKIIKDHKELFKSFDVFDKIDPLVLASQYEKEITRMKNNHCQMLEDLYKEIHYLRTKNRDLLDELILMNGGNYCSIHLESLRQTILKSSTNNNQKHLCDILDCAKLKLNYKKNMNQNTESNKFQKLPDLLAIKNKLIHTNIEKNLV
ncbi:uncharacterized protein LOC126902998 [Daktulosphaira vitifoliae]|uniref:uncharacterized protein LOC126902998 n=1 Tax=Daktulosphaira vitifoliae TaxID=58002 RepID=UPI0021AA9381|nr:uncharacterized protein LOC126902998 [Daktulosphaira vitifoliae]